MDADYADDLVLLANTPTQTKSLLHSVEQATRSISLYVNLDKTEFMPFKEDGIVTTLKDWPLKLVDHFIYFGSNITSTESNFNIHTGKTGPAIDRVSTICKSDLSDKTAVLLWLYCCTYWTSTQHLEKK